MSDIVIHRCSVRVVRHGGWSWGPRPQELLQALLRALPDLIEARLEELALAAGGDREITAPVRIDVRVPAGPAGASSAPLSPAERLIAAAAERVGRAAGDRDAEPALGLPGRAAAACVSPAADRARDEAPRVPPRTAWEVLAAIVGGDADRLIATLPSPALADWARWTAPDPLDPAAADDEATAVWLALSAAAARASSTAASATGSVRDTAAPGSTGSVPPTTAPDGPRPVRAAELRAPHELRVDPARSPWPSLPGAPATSPGEPAVDQTIGPAVARLVRRLSRGRFDVLALPFLAAGVLARLGYIDAVAVAIAAENQSAPAFAQAFAAKLTDPPERGWRRSARDRDTAAALAGLVEPLPDEALHDLARAAPRFAAGIDGIVTALLLEDRARDVPLMLVRCASGDLTVVDPTGLFVVARGPSALDAVGAAGAPVRAAADVPGDLLVGHRRSRLGAAEAERVAEILAALDARTAVPRAADPTLERTLMLAAALALGTLAWRLWPDEDPDPLLTLQRFGDLDGSASLERDRIVVRLPLGRRHRDLDAAGFLGTARLPWLGERELELTSG